VTKDPAGEFRLGTEELGSDKMELAAKSFERAYATDKTNAEYMSYYGLCAALQWGRIGKAINLCTKAIKIDFKRADFYLNLGRVYLESGNKKGAVTVFKKGLGIDPEHKGLHDILISMGIKEEALLPFLSRAHPINKRLGIFFKRRLPSLLSSKGPKKTPKNKG